MLVYTNKVRPDPTVTGNDCLQGKHAKLKYMDLSNGVFIDGRTTKAIKKVAQLTRFSLHQTWLNTIELWM